MHKKKVPAAYIQYLFKKKTLWCIFPTSFVWQKIRVITYEKNSFWRKTDKISDMEMKRLSERMFYSFV